jgi:hypothetical protein
MDAITGNGWYCVLQVWAGFFGIDDSHVRTASLKIMQISQIPMNNLIHTPRVVMMIMVIRRLHMFRQFIVLSSDSNFGM